MVITYNLIHDMLSIRRRRNKIIVALSKELMSMSSLILGNINFVILGQDNVGITA